MAETLNTCYKSFTHKPRLLDVQVWKEESQDLQKSFLYIEKLENADDFV